MEDVWTLKRGSIFQLEMNGERSIFKITGVWPEGKWGQTVTAHCDYAEAFKTFELTRNDEGIVSITLGHHNVHWTKGLHKTWMVTFKRVGEDEYETTKVNVFSTDSGCPYTLNRKESMRFHV